MGKILHMNLAKQYAILDHTPPYYAYTPSSVMEDSNSALYWHRSILTNTPNNTSIPNRPDILSINKTDKTATIIDFAIPLDNNIQQTINTKIAKYQPLAQYIKNTHNLERVKIIPIVISST